MICRWRRKFGDSNCLATLCSNPPLLVHYLRRRALAPWVAAQGSQHAKEMQDQPGQDEGHVAHADKHGPDDPVDNLPLVELAQDRQKEAQESSQTGAPQSHRGVIDHDDTAARRVLEVWSRWRCRSEC